ncbi:gp53-like domain-containing protein [Pseudomonas donghuensis]
MVNALAGKAARANTLAGYNIGDAFTKAETNAAIKATVDALVNGAPGAMDQLSELAAAMGNDPNFATTMLNQLATKAALASPVFTGDPKAPTPAAGDNDASLATTAFVQTAVNGLQAVDVSGSGSITLNATQAGSAIIYLHGALTGDRTVVLPTRWGLYVIRNATNQPFKLTVKMATGTGVEITQGCVSGIMTDATNTLLQQTDFNSPILTGDPRAPTPPTTDNDTSISTTAFVRNVLASLGLGDVSSSATIADMDDVSIPSGLYYVTPYTLHSPEGLQGAVIHKVYGGGGFQLFFPYSVQRVLWRRRGGSQWMEWDELSPKRTTLAGYGIADGVRVQSDQFPAFNSKSAGLNFTEGAIQIREAGKVGAAQSDILFAPAITFHWAERVFKHLLMSSGGDLHWGPTGKLIHTDNMGPVLFALKDAANMAAVRNLLGITNTSSFGAGSGWWRDGQTGLMIQYGTVLAQAETVYPATFQTAFPNFCLMVIPTNLNSATGDDDAFARVVSWTRQNVSLKAEYGTGTGHSPAARNIAYLAIGY